ncbi:MAG: MBL fold metallo-hydrolase [Verrucomicrobia bacterium]|nr:MBL fold metallo-hydrolase [Verrucomicrobiota bacterium]
MQGFCPLASGSKGNAIFFGTKNTRILIDAGISAKTVAERLDEIGVDLRDIDAILITHEHTDHIKGLSSLALRYRIPVFANSDTAKAIVEILGEAPRFKIFSTGETFEFGDIEVHPFSIQHDTLDPVAFTIRTGQIKTGFCTDLGFATTLVKNHLQNCDYLYIEANHQPSMVHACSRPPIYKQRVLSRQGHLSNEQCAELLEAVVHPDLKHIHLAHLSQECNCPELALDIIYQKLLQLGYQIETSIAFQESISRAVIF